MNRLTGTARSNFTNSQFVGDNPFVTVPATAHGGGGGGGGGGGSAGEPMGMLLDLTKAS